MSHHPSLHPHQPRIRHNDYTSLEPPRLGEWSPRTAVSVVVPAFGNHDKLALVLAALASQSYPSNLLEVVVADDGSYPPIEAPQLAPDNTKVVRTAPHRWGPAHAVDTAMKAADGDVALRLDSDVLPCREHVEAHMRWHHLADYLTVMGSVRYVEFSGNDFTASEVHKAVADGRVEELFHGMETLGNWSDQVLNDTRHLVEAGSRAFRVADGATISWSARLYDAAGGIDAELILGSDTELGYRLAQAGAVFVPESRALGWHLGMSQMKTRRDDGRRYRLAHLRQRVPLQRDWRRETGRQWKIPYVEVVVDADGAAYEDVRATVSGTLASTLSDIRVTILGQWSSLPEGRRAVLDDPLLDQRLIHEEFSHDGRVRLRESIPSTSSPVPFRFTCPPGLVPTADALRRLIEVADSGFYGQVLLAFPRGNNLWIAKLERTQAVSRALALAGADEDLVDVIDDVFGTRWLDGSEWALVTADTVPNERSVPQLTAGLDKWRQLAERRRRELELYRQDAERWKDEAAQLRRLQEPLPRRVLARVGLFPPSTAIDVKVNAQD